MVYFVMSSEEGIESGPYASVKDAELSIEEMLLKEQVFTDTLYIVEVKLKYTLKREVKCEDSFNVPDFKKI